MRASLTSLEWWHYMLHLCDPTVSVVGGIFAVCIAVQMVYFVTHYRMQTQAVGGARWPGLWWWNASQCFLFGVLLLINGTLRMWPELCVTGMVVRLVSCTVLMIASVSFQIGIQDARGFYKTPSRQDQLREMVLAVGQRALRQLEAQAERNGT